MQNLLEELKTLLEHDERLSAEGKLLKNKVVELALNLDPSLIKLLIKNENIKRHFFTDIDRVLVFDKIKFQKFVSNKQFLPDSYTAFKNKIGLVNEDGEYLSESRDVVLAWPYKDCVLKGGQTKEDQKRDEVFYNETLAPDEIDRLVAPKVLTNLKRYDKDGEHKLTGDIDFSKENFIIKGNNLLALHALKKRFAGKVKLIYIDPPYNTGSDSFLYNDSFNHTSWMTFMKNRLEAAWELLSKDGCIIVHCDFIEDSYIKVVMDEIFGRNNFINIIAIRDSHPSGLKLSAREKTIIKTKSTMLIYKKSGEIRITPVYQKRYEWDGHFNIFIDIDSKERVKNTLADYVKKNKIISDDNFVLNERALDNDEFRKFAFENRSKIFQSTKEMPEEARENSLKNKDKVIEYAQGEYALNGRRLSPLSKSIYNVGFDGYFVEDFGKLLCDFWDDVDFNNSQNEGGVSFPSGKKPELLLARLITMFTKKGELVLDFYLGSGTTAAVTHKMGRQYIGIEQLDYGENDSVVRLQNVIKGDQSGISKTINWKGGGSFIYCELNKYNQEYIDRVQDAKTTEELKAIWQAMQEKAFLSYKVDIKTVNENIREFVALSIEGQKRFLTEILDKNQLYVNYCDMGDKDYNITEEDKRLNKKFYEGV